VSRVCVCSGRIGSADPLEAGRAIGRSFADAAAGRAQVAVVPAADGGEDLATALSALAVEVERVASEDAYELGRLLASTLLARPGRVLVDLTALMSVGPDGPLRFLDGLGLTPHAAAVGNAVAGVELIGVLPHDQTADLLLGIGGVAARRGFAAGSPAAGVLDADAALARLASDLGVVDAPGLGAAGGIAAVLAALGGRLTSGFDLCRDAAGLAATLARADLVVAGTDTFTTGDFGGPVVLGLAAMTSEAAVPCLAVARDVEISTRELRRHGVEAARALGGGPELTASEISARMAPIAVNWTW
jgi:glycerate 2-kinase